MRRLRTASIPSVLSFCLAACASTPEGAPPGPRLVGPGGAADGEGPAALFLCRVTKGDGTDFFRRDVLSCAPGEGSPYAPYIDVTGKNGSFVGTIDVGASGSVELFADAYPLSMRVYGELAEAQAPVGLEHVTLRFELSVQSAEQWSAPLGPTLPFDVVTLAIENRTSYGELTLDPVDVTAEGATFESRGVQTSTFRVDPTGMVFTAGERRTVRVPVTRGTEEVTGAAGPLASSGSGTTGPRFSVPSGGYAITEDGLVEADDILPIEAGPALAHCEALDGKVQCSVVPYNGVTFAEATATLGDVTVALPLNGTVATVGAAEDVATVALSVRVASGIDGVEWDTMEPLTGELALAPGGRADLDLPFDLVHPALTFDGVERAFFDVEGHTVRLRRAWSGLFEIAGTMFVDVSPSEPNAWIAVSPGVKDVTGNLTTLSASGAVQMYDGVTLADGVRYAVTAEGLARVEESAR